MVAFGVATYVFLQPKEGSIEWHKREYLAAWKTLNEQTLGARVKASYYRVTKTAPETPNWDREDRMQRASDKLWSSKTNLLRLGYFTQYPVALSSRATLQFLSSFNTTPVGRRELVQRREWRFIDLQDEGPNAVTLTGPRIVLDEFRNYLDKSAVP